MAKTKTTKLTVDIPTSKIDEYSKQQIKSLEAKVERLENKITKLKYEISSNQNMIDRAKRIVKAVREAGEFYEADDWQNFEM